MARVRHRVERCVRVQLDVGHMGDLAELGRLAKDANIPESTIRTYLRYAEAAELRDLQSGAWVPADAMAFDKVVEPGELRNEIIAALTA